MSGLSLALDLDSQPLDAAFERAIRAAIDLGPAMDEMGLAAVSSAQERFESKKGPDGQSWVPSKKSSGETLIGQGHLRDSLSYRHDSRSFEYGTNRIYAAIQQFGGVIKPKNKKVLSFLVGGQRVFARSVTLSARPFVGFSQEDELEFAQILEDHITRAWAS